MTLKLTSLSSSLGIHLSKFEITGITHGSISAWTKTISMGEGETKSEEVVGCENRCDSDGLLFFRHAQQHESNLLIIHCEWQTKID